jgi:hypothetical protein
VTGIINVALSGRRREWTGRHRPGCAGRRLRPRHTIAAFNSSGTFDAVAGATYYVVVDGYAGHAGAYTLTV